MNLFLLFIVFTISLISCTNKPISSNSKDLSYPSTYTPASFVQLTSKGINIFPSVTNAVVYFSSSTRHHHKKFQIYKLDLETKKEKQVSHNDGNNILPFLVKDLLFYTSTTDEIKEENYNLNYLYKKKLKISSFTTLDFEPKLNFYEFYSANPNGNFLRRLISHPGTDIAWHYNLQKRTLYFSSLENNRLQILTAAKSGKIKTTLVKNKKNNIYLKSSASGKSLAWVELISNQDKNNTELSHIIVSDHRGRNKKTLTKHLSINTHPNWHPGGNQIIFSSNRVKKENFELYVLNIESGCLQRLTYTTSRELWPSFNSAGDKIIFSSDKTGTFQIYSMDYLPPKTCQ